MMRRKRLYIAGIVAIGLVAAATSWLIMATASRGADGKEPIDESLVTEENVDSLSDESTDEPADEATNELESAEEETGAIEAAPTPEIAQETTPAPGATSTGTNTESTADARGHMVDGVKVIYYRTTIWGSVEANFDDFKSKVAETLNDPRGWVRAGLKFVEVTSGQDVDVILSDPASLEATAGCSGDLSCTTWANQVIINDVRWREGTEVTLAAGASTRDYQHMVVNHEMGHWLGHYAHIEGCTAENGFAGGPAPIMLQQSTGLRGCASFNAWPLESELWTLR